MDYRELLKKYMAHVSNMEGSTYVDWFSCSIGEIALPLTDAEQAELKLLDEEIKSQYLSMKV